MGDLVFSIEAQNLSLRDAILLAKAHVVHSSSFVGHDDSVNDYSGSGAPFDLFMDTLGGPKWFTTLVRRTPGRPALTSGEFLKGATINQSVRSFVRQFVPTWHWEYYDGSFINTDVTLSGILALREKMQGVVGDDGRVITRLGMSDPAWKYTKVLFWHFLGIGDSDIPFYMDDETLNANFFRSAAGVGFDSSATKVCGTKGNNVDLNGIRCQWIAGRLSLGDSPESFLPPWGHITGLKPEVFGPDVPRDKIRFIFQQNMECGSFTKHFTMPIQRFLETRPWYMPGKGVFGEQLPYLLSSLCHPDFYEYSPHPPPTGEKLSFNHYVLLDLSGQDWSYISEVLVLIMSSLMSLIKPPESNVKFVVDIAGWAVAWTVCKLIQCWGRDYKYSLGSFASGSDWTTLADTAEMMLVVLITVVHLSFPSDLWVLSEIRFVTYGDDTVLSLTKRSFDFLFPNGSSSAFGKAAKQACGAVFKASQTLILPPVDSHVDRFYTWVQRVGGREFVESEGLCILKRRWVKYDSELNPLHPDTPMSEVKCVLPWRPTTDLVPKIGLDAKNWGGTDTPWIKWYQKAFGLLIDACANIESHCMLMQAMDEVRLLYPVQVSEAESSFSWRTTENVWKLGKDFDDTLICIIPRSKLAMRIIATLYLTTRASVAAIYPRGVNLSMYHIFHAGK